LIQKEIETPLGRLILKGEVKDGDTVVADKEAQAANLNFRVEPHAEERQTLGDDTGEKASAA
jgi:ATP-dependent Clp protease ATP-binding subunit ClpA